MSSKVFHTQSDYITKGEKMKFRKLRASEIDVRVSQVKEKWMTLLLYKDARVDQNILDETVGPENWQRSHEIIGDNLYCTVSIWDAAKKAWVSKQDVGTESKTEAEKGQASDSFKRACFNWGIGRELYTAPSIKIYFENGIDKYTKFKVGDIAYDSAGNINKLVLTVGDKPVYKFEDPREVMLKEIKVKYPDGSENLKKLLECFGVESLEQATQAQITATYNKVHKA